MNIDMDFILTLLFYSVPFIFILICLYYLFYYLSAARNLEDMPASKIRSAAQGYVELSGLAQPIAAKPILGKITKKPCAWCRYTIEKFNMHLSTTQNQSNMQGSWCVVEEGMSFDPFLLNDGTGECIIFPKGAEILSKQKIQWRGHTRTPSLPPTSFLLWLLWSLWNSWGSYRYTEYRIELGMPLYVSGRFMTLKATDVEFAATPFIRDYLQEKNGENVHVIVKKDLSAHENFIISTLQRKRLIRYFRFKALLFFIAVLVFASFAFHANYPTIQHIFKKWRLPPAYSPSIYK